MQIMQNRPPFVMFETQAVKDPIATEAAGIIQYKNVDYALITPSGSKDQVVKIAVEWLAQIRKQALDGIYDPDWVKHFTLRYEEFKKGNEMPENGTPLKMWPAITPADIAVLHAARIFTVEDLAVLPDSGFQVVGMGARALRDKAVAWLGAGDKGKTAEQIAKLTADVANLMQRLEAEFEKRKELEAALRKKGVKLAETET